MKCPQCQLVEMWLKEMKDNKYIWQCKKCHLEIEEDIPEETEETE